MKLAVFTPLSPLRSGIADYSAALLPHLAERLEIEAFIDDGYEADPLGGDSAVPIRHRSEYRAEDFDETLFQLGNNPHHVYIYDAALEHKRTHGGGILLLHEFNLHHLIAAALIKRDRWDDYMAEVRYEGGEKAWERAQRVRALEVGPDYDGVAMNKRVIEAGKAVIVHSDFMVGKVREADPDASVWCVPHGAWIPEVDRNGFRERLGVAPDEPLIGIFGFLKPYKRIKESLRAMRRLVRLEPRAKMILVGEEHPELPVRRMIADMGLEANAQVLGFVDIDAFVKAIGACDVCLNLRYPTVGETSGTLLRSLGLGRATIVSDVGAFADLPDDICLKVPVGAGETETIFEFLHLLVTRPELRRAVGERARLHVATECAWPAVARRFEETICAIHEGRRPAAPRPPRESSEKAPAARRARPAAAPSPPPPSPSPYIEYIRGFCHDRPQDARYVDSHLTRLVRTLEITPPGGADDAALEMGAYMHITPALRSKLGYGEVRGCYLGPLGEVDRRAVASSSGERFECEIDLFDAEKDRYPYEDGRFATVLCCELLEHLYEDPMHLMAEVNRILREGGRLVLSTPNACSLRALSATLLSYHPGLFHHYVKPDAEGRRDPRHAREYAPRDLQALFEAAGFAVELLESGPYIERDSLELEWINRLLERHELTRELRGDCLHIVGRKTGPVRERYPAALYAD